MPSDKPNNGVKLRAENSQMIQHPYLKNFQWQVGPHLSKKLYHIWGRSSRQTGRRFDTPDLVCRYPNIPDSLQLFEHEGGMSLCSSYIHGVSVY
jgi:hypothetical protein